jgi:predicted nuclease of predicted toxin-antitoxin system
MMRFLVDQPVSPLLTDWLRQAGHEAFHVRERGLSRASDAEIFSVATSEGAIIVTADLDFSRIVALSGRAEPGLILFRPGNLTDEQMLELLKTVIDRVPAEQLQRAIVVADKTTLRVAPLPLRPDLTG